MRIEEFLKIFGDKIQRYKDTKKSKNYWCADQGADDPNSNKFDYNKMGYVHIVSFDRCASAKKEEIYKNKPYINFGIDIDLEGGNLKKMSWYVYPLFDDEFEGFRDYIFAFISTNDQNFEMETIYSQNSIFNINKNDIVVIEPHKR